MLSTDDTGNVRRTSVLDLPIYLSRVNWEVVAYAAIILVTFAIRFAGLGDRALHHDEAQHARFTWDYFRGAGYAYNPMLHGPFLYHFGALIYFLFGVSDTTARLGPALVGTLLVGLTWYLRPHLGQFGALAAGVLLALSPAFSYYSRSLRHDMYATTATFVVAVCILAYLRRPQPRALYFAAAALAIGFASHELTFISLFIFATLLPILFLLEPFLHPAGRSEGPVATAARAILARPRQLLIAFIIFFIIFAAFYTNFFTYPTGLGDGITKSLSYWLGQQGVQRGNQPWFYYLLLLPVYETIAVFFGLAAAVFFLTRKRSAWADPAPGAPADALPARYVAFALTYWFVMALIIYSWAGEKMPWLVLQPALPLTLLAALLIGYAAERFPWRRLASDGAIYVAAAAVLVLAIFVSLMGMAQQASSTDLAGQYQTLRAVTLVVFAVIILAIAWRWLRKLGVRSVLQTLAVLSFAILSVYMVSSTWNLNYRNGATPVEMLVYTQTSPDVPYVVDRIRRLSRDVTLLDRSTSDPTGGHGLTVAIDHAVEWPFDWYLRDFTRLSYFTAGQENLDPSTAVILVAADDTTVQQTLGSNYVGQRFKLRWWFPEEQYRSLSIGQIAGGFVNGDAWSSLLRYLFYRDPGAPLGSYDFTMYVRNDLAARIGMSNQPLAPGTSTTKPYSLSDEAGQGNADGQFNQPRDVAIGPSGDIYVIDTGNGRIQKFAPDGTFLAKWGSFGQGEGELGFIQGNGPVGIAVDKDENVYVADTWNHRIEKFDKDGKFLLTWGSFVNTQGEASANQENPAKFFGPRGLAFDSAGDLYVTDTGNKRVLVFDASGKYLRQFGTVGSGPGQMDEPIGIAIDSQDNVYVADTRNTRIEKFDKDGNYLADWRVDGWQPAAFNEPYLTVAANGNLFVSDPSGSRLLEYSPDGKLVNTLAEANGVTMSTPTGLAMDSSGTMYVVDTGLHRVLTVPPGQ